MNAGPKKRYKNPNGPGFIRLSDERARRMGLLPSLDDPAPAPDPILSSDRVAVPSGALAPGGPTARARAAAAKPDPDEKTKEADGTKKRDAPTTPNPGTSGRRRRVAGAK